MTKYKQDHFVLNRWILRGAGLWAPETKSKFVAAFFKFYAITIFLFVNLYFTITEFVSIKDTYKDINSLIKNLSFALTHLLGTIKVLFWYLNRAKLMNIINILESEEYNYESNGDFQPGRIFRKSKQTGIKYTCAFFIMAHVTVSSAYIPAIITTFNYVENEQGNLTFFHLLPYYSWIPFKYQTPKSYLFALAYQMGPMYSYAYSIVGMDTLFMNILNLVGAHMSVVKGAFQNIRARCVNKTKHRGFNKKELCEMMTKEFKRCVRHTQTIFTVRNDLERIYTFLTLIQVLFTLFIFCTCLFLVSTTPITSKRFASEMVYLIAMGFQLMLFCWFGNEVTLRTSQIPDALWQSDWLDTDSGYRSNMLITMIRMRRPLYLTAGKFAPLTLNTFVAILKSSYSFFAVLKRVNE